MKTRLALLICCFTIGCGPSVHEIIVRDATVTSNAHAIILQDQRATAESLYRLEQDQAFLLGGDVRARVTKIRVAWAPAWAWLDLAQFVHRRLARLVLTGDKAAIELSEAELQEIETRVGAYVVAARQRIGQAK